jgi:hypothetical protein
MHTTSSPFSLLVTLGFSALFACGDENEDCCQKDSGDNLGGEEASASCVDTEVAIGPDEATPAGATGTAMMAAIPASQAGTVVWNEAGESSGSVGFTVDASSLVFVDSEPAPSEGGEEPAIEAWCEDSLQVEAVLSFDSGDGALVETIPVRLVRYESATGDDLGFSAELDPTALNGSFDATAYAEEGYEELRLFVNGNIMGGIVSLTINVQSSGSDGEVAWAANGEVAVFTGSAI